MWNAKLMRSCAWIFIIVYIVMYSHAIISGAGIFDKQETVTGGDFRCFYAASHKLWAGDIPGIYDARSLYAVQQHITGRTDINVIGWFYPPLYLLFVAWLAALPYFPALFAWLAITLAGYVLVVRQIVPHPYTAWLVLAYPGVFQNVVYGQNGFLSALLLGQGLVLLERRPVWAGLILGLLVFKPHLAFLVVVALVAAGKWRALCAAGAAATVLTGISIALFGIGSWAAFFHTLPEARFGLEAGGLPWGKMITLFAQARLWGASVPLAYALQAACTAATVAAVVWVWRKGVCPPAYIVLSLGVLLATPYAYEYDLTILGLAIAWYSWEGLHNGWLSGEKPVLVLAWLMPLLNAPVAGATDLKLVLVTLVMLLMLVVRRRYVWDAAGENRGKSIIQKPATEVCAGLGGDD